MGKAGNVGVRDSAGVGSAVPVPLESEGGGRGRKGGGSSPAPPGREHGGGQNQTDHPRRHLARPL